MVKPPSYFMPPRDLSVNVINTTGEFVLTVGELLTKKFKPLSTYIYFKNNPTPILLESVLLKVLDNKDSIKSINSDARMLMHLQYRNAIPIADNRFMAKAKWADRNNRILYSNMPDKVIKELKEKHCYVFEGDISNTHEMQLIWNTTQNIRLGAPSWIKS